MDADGQHGRGSFAGLQAIAHLLAAAGTGNERRRHLVRTCSIQLRRVHARNLGRARGAKIGNKMRLWRLHWILGVWRVHLCTRCMSVVPRREMLLHGLCAVQHILLGNCKMWVSNNSWVTKVVGVLCVMSAQMRCRCDAHSWFVVSAEREPTAAGKKNGRTQV